MIKLSKALLIAVALVVLGLVVALPITAQGEGGPGRGGIVIEGTFGGDPATFNIILASDTSSTDVILKMWPAFVYANPETAQFDQSGPNALVNAWEVSDDGTVYTFHLRDDLPWSDGTPMTSADVLYTWNAISSGVVDTPLIFITDAIEGVEAPDPYTVVVTMKENDCDALFSAGLLYPFPSHLFSDNYEELNTADFNTNPTVSMGAFQFGEFRPAEQTSLVANQDFPDALLGYVSPEGWIYKQVPDQTVVLEQFLAGETNYINAPNVSRRADVRAAEEAGDVIIYEYAGDFFDYFAFNLADPTNPQDGADADGNRIDQGNHPLFGDVRVRQAITMAIDVDALIQGAVFGEGVRMTSFLGADSWAYNHDLPPIAFDPDAAIELLAEAGWTDEDGDGILEAHGAMYAEDGTPLAFTMFGNEGNSRRAAEGQLIQDQLSQIGVDAQYEAIDFNTLLDIMNAQTFDVVMLAWQLGFPDRPDQTQLFTTVGDVVGSGSNFTSYYNPEFEELNEQARTLPGCDQEERAEIYREMQVIMQEDVPYVWMYSIKGMYAVRSNVEGFSPFPQNPYWNLDAWTVHTPE